MACTYIFGGKTYNESDLDLLYKNVRAYVNSTTKELETIDIEIQDDKASKIVAGTKTTILRTERQGKQIGLPVGQSAYITIGGTPFIITNRGLLDINEAGGQDAILNSEDIASVDNFVFDYSKNWFLGKGKLYVYDITSLPKSEQDPDDTSGITPTRVNEKNNPLLEAGVKPTDMKGNAAKDIEMAEQATQFIGYQAGNAKISSTGKYRAAWGDKANTGNYTSNDVVMVSASGLFRGVTAEDIKGVLTEKYKPLLEEAIAAGVSFLVGNQYDKGNFGDQLVSEYLSKKGYTETKFDGYSRWSKPTQAPVSGVKPFVKDFSRWADLAAATQPYTKEGIVVTRIQNTTEHFGNPFIGSLRRDKDGNLVKAKADNITRFNTIDEADQAYRDWLLGLKHQNIEPKRREWILKQINEGKLDNQTLLYYKPMDVTNIDGTKVIGGYHSHADTLSEVVEQLRTTKAPVSAQTILANDTPLNKRKIRLENLGYTFTEMAGTFKVDHINIPFSLDAITLEDAIKLAEADYNTNAQDDNLGISMEDIGPEVPISDSLLGKLFESIGVDVEALTGRIDDFVDNFNEPKYKALRDRLINSPYFDESSITFLDIVNNPKLLKQNPDTIKAEPLENPVYEEKQISYRGTTYTVYLQNGIPVKTDLKQSEEQSDEDYKNLNRAIIEFYKRVNRPKQLTIEDQLTAEKGENPVNDNSSKTLQDEQVTAYEVIQSWLDRDIPMTANEEENFYNHTFFLSGPGGSGKTYISEILLKGRNPAIAAPTHQAKGVLSRNFPEVQAQTVQSLFGMKPVPRKDNEFYSLTLEEITSYLTSGDEKTAALAPSFFDAKNKPIFLIDEASMLGGHYELEKADINIWVEDESGKAKSVEKTVYIEPDLGTLLQKFTDLYYELNGVHPKVLLTGDIAQTPMVDTPKGAVSSILQNLKDKGNYFELLKIRRTDNKGIADLSMGIRNQIIGAVDSKDSKVKNETLLRILEVFKNTTFYSDEYEHTTVEGEFVDTFVKYYKTNIKEKQDPEYTQMINFNAENNPWTVRMNNLIRKSLFGEKAAESLVEGEVIILTTPNIPASFVEAGTLTSLPLLKDTKAFITKLESSERKYTYRSNKTSREISVVVPGFNLTANVYHPDKGEGNPIEVTLFVVDQSVRSAISESFQQFNENPEIYKVDFFGKGLTRRELYIFASEFPYWSFGYIVNNYKIQGSAVKNPFVHMQNIYDAPGVKDYLHIAQFLYTGVSRTREKLFTYHPKLNFKSLPGTRPVECQ